MVSRRQFIAGTGLALLGAPAIVRAVGMAVDLFGLGVTSGDPAPDGFVIWTRLAMAPLDPHGAMTMQPMPVRWEVAADAAFRSIVAAGEATARPELGHSVHVEVTGLQPQRPYWYRFSTESGVSPIGRARTLPHPGSSQQAFKFGVCGCQNYEDGFWPAFRHLAAEDDLAFVYHYGDFIYEGAGKPIGEHPTYWGTTARYVRSHIGRECYSLDDYRLRYSQYLSDPELRAARAAHSWFPTYDDHEVANNWADAIDPRGTPPEIFRFRRQAALQAWYEFMPVRRSSLPLGPAITAYRGARYGDLVSFDFLDTRQYRTDQPCGDGFKPACPDIMDRAARMISAEQEAWLERNLHSAGTAWHCVAQQVMMMALDRRSKPDQPDKILNLDSWAGYEAQRRRLLARMKGLGNVIVLTGDEHQNFAGTLDDGDAPVGVEFVATSISSGGDGSDVRPGSDIMLANNPNLKFMNDQRGYLVCDITPHRWATHFMVVDNVSTPAAAMRRRATATVARGAVRLTLS